MRETRLPFGILALCLAALPAASAGGPQVTGQFPLPATPGGYSLGLAGPFNRIAFDVTGFGPPDMKSAVACIYPGGFRYRCDTSSSEIDPKISRRRVTVTIPDLGRGKQVVVRFSTSTGQQDVPVVLANSPQVVHEIEALPLPNGGQVTVSMGVPIPNMNVVITRATTMPAMAMTPLIMDACDQVRAEWVTVSATDPVFQSQFGVLNGSIVPARPVMPGSRVHPNNLPEWLVTYPLSAFRLQFIAHYEVIYRVGSCPHRVITDPPR